MDNIKFLLFLLLFPTFLFSQKSKTFIIQVKNDVKDFQIKKNFSRSSTYRKIKQISNEPLNLWLVEVNDERTTSTDLYKSLDRNNEVISIKENRKISNRAKPNDASYNSQWQYNNTGTNSNGGKVGADINIESAWDITTGGVTLNGDTIVVAIVDDGLNITHEDIAPNLWTNRNEIPNDSIDNDNNGFIDDIHGWNFESDNNDVKEGGGHGTPVAGIVGAKGNNGKGVTGVNWDVKLLPIIYGSGDEAGALASYAYAYKLRKMYNETNGQKGAFIVATNSSWGIDYADPNDAPLWCAFYDSLGTIGILSAGATANQNVNVDIDGDLPTGCESEYLISVTNLNKQDNKVTGAGYGIKSVDIGAYGESVYTVSSNSYGSFGGTSGATPHVAGTIALLYSVECNLFNALYKSNPAKAALSVKDLIFNNTTPNPSIANITTTGGKLNVYEAVFAMQNQCSNCITAAAITTENLSVNSVDISWRVLNAYTKIRYKKIEAVDWITSDYILNASNVVLSELDFCAEYQYQVSSICEGVVDKWSYLKYFKTSGCCLAPEISVEVSDKINIFNLSQDSITIEYKSNSSANWISNKIFYDTSLYINNNCNQYEIRAQQYCPLQDSFSTYSDVINVSANCGACGNIGYCVPDDLNNNSEWIDSVYFDNKVNYSSKNENAYGNYIGKIIPEIALGDTMKLRLVPGYISSAYNEFFKVYVDWNQDNNFDDTEIAYESPKARNIAVDSFIVAPSNAIEGYTRLRVVMNYRQGSPPCEDESSDFGEIEDYCLLVKDSIVANKYLSIVDGDRVWYGIEKAEVTRNIKFRINKDSFLIINDENFYTLESNRTDNDDDWKVDFYLSEKDGIVSLKDNFGVWKFYDFNLAVGDSILNWIHFIGDYYVVNKVDSVTYNDGIVRKRIHLQNSNIIWVEGIGSIIETFYYSDNVFLNTEFHLTCYFENDVLIYENTEDDIDGCFIVGTKDVYSKNITLYPNPTTGLININSEESGLLNLYDLRGINLLKKEILGGDNELDLSSLTNGAYMCKLVFIDGTYKSIMIIKQ